MHFIHYYLAEIDEFTITYIQSEKDASYQLFITHKNTNIYSKKRMKTFFSDEKEPH